MRINYHHTIRTTHFLLALLTSCHRGSCMILYYSLAFGIVIFLYTLMQLTLFGTIYGKSLRAHLRVIYLRMHPTFV